MAKLHRARQYATRDGVRSANASPTSFTKIFCSDSTYWLATSSRCGGRPSSDQRVVRISGPQCVCEQLINKPSGGRAYFSSAAFSKASRIGRGTLIKSLVTITIRVPIELSNARAFTNRSCTLPSDGLSRLAYPAIHMG